MPKQKRTAAKTITLPKLAKGEIYKGLIVDEKGKPLHHVVELKSAASLPWVKAKEHAKKLGYSLPSRREGALLRASDPSGQTGWFWLDAQYEGYGDYAWAQRFGGGNQSHYRKGFEFAVRLVRTIQIR